MKSRHAAALALVGWYLLVPPHPSATSVQNYDLNAPLAQWGIFRAFDTAAECEEARADLIKPQPSPSEMANIQLPPGTKLMTGKQLEDFIEYQSHAQCLSSDDPRLAK